MLSLRRRKTQSGDTPTSARAVTSVLLESLYYYNKQPEFQKPKAYQSTSRRGLKGQLGAYSRTLLILGYVIAFCALLRIDELLKIQLQDITTSKDPKSGRGMLTLRLPFRKTSQFGGKVE
ncbi:DNA breaking-rejoining enzyme [Lentinula edodes]|uniref:DNA breaking-rejoining enzyme n=1 Tax=Lentinula edodes TaxID=5353 RepID=A0A1Q3E9H4_LENED|nr:DNA breaking-rejoining enzyme [Lentinula edodes]